MRNPDPLGDRYPISGPQWRELLKHCKKLTRADAQERLANADKEQGNFWRTHVVPDQVVPEGMDEEALSRAMQAEVNKDRGR